MSNTDNLTPEYQHHKDKERVRGRRIVWSRLRSKPWTPTLMLIGALIVAVFTVGVSYLIAAHPGKPEPNPGIETQARP